MASSRPFRILVIHNPASGGSGGPRFGRVLAALTAAEAEVDVHATTRRGDAEAIARQRSGEGFDVIVAAGGDGTIAEVANGLDEGAPPLGIIALGTANVFAAELGLPHSSHGIARVILHGMPRPVFAGRANGRRFLLMAGAGLDAEVVAGVDPAFKRRFGKWAYVIETLKQMTRYGYPALDVTTDTDSYRGVTAVACKGRRYGGPHVMAPGADLARPDFELVLFGKGGWPRVLLYGLALVTGAIRFMPGVRRVRATEVHIEGPPGAPVQGDGDIDAALPVSITIDPRPITVLYPPKR